MTPIEETLIDYESKMQEIEQMAVDVLMSLPPLRRNRVIESIKSQDS